ncbi:MAG: hypothetical protein K8I30_07975, partial [Anaerolineae bacterium]|nr:hypothetical protein [Anaerolineae bacterium]
SLAVRPTEQAKRELWRRHNRLEKTRPIVFCDPENSWHEILPAEALRCTNPIARDWEFHLRKQIFWGEQMGDDYTVEPYFNVAHVHSKPDWGLVEQVVGGEHGGAYTWDSPIQTEADIDRLHAPTCKIDFDATNALAARAELLFGDLLRVRIKTTWWWTLGMTWTLANLRGLEQIMFDMLDNPHLLHRLMAVLRDGTLKMIHDLEAASLLYLNNDGTYVGSGALGWSDELPQPDFNGYVRPKDMWALAESQETVSISPRMFNDFVLPYQMPILELFGLTCYGCCEPLDNRWKYVKTIPNLRRVSVSPWANREFMAGQLEDRYIFSMKPNPADLAMDTVDEDRIRAILRHDLEVSRGCHVEIVLKDTHTIRHEPQRVIRYVQIAREEIARL